MSRKPRLPLQGCHVVSLRPVGGHETMRRAARRQGATLLALSPWRLVPCVDAQTLAALKAALAAPVVVFTSPAAVRAAVSLTALRVTRSQDWLAVGEGTAQALRLAGVKDVEMPARMDSEGLLALSALTHLERQAVGLVTAPGGRGLLSDQLIRRGAELHIAHVYVRKPIAPAAAAIARIKASRGRLWLALSSAQALDHVLAALPASARDRLLQAGVAAASARLARHAQALGFGSAFDMPVVIAASPRPADLLNAMTRADAGLTHGALPSAADSGES